MLWVIMFLVWAWSCGAYRYLVGVPGFVILPIMIIVPICVIRSLKWRKTILVIAGILFVVVLVRLLLERPTWDRDWIDSCRKPPVVRLLKDKEIVEIENVREFKWRSVDDYDEAWVKHSYYLDQLDSLDLVIEPLGDSKLFAHIKRIQLIKIIAVLDPGLIIIIDAPPFEFSDILYFNYLLIF
jgi:hypothetical protein